QRGALREEQRNRLALTAQTLITNLEDIADQEENEEDEAEAEAEAEDNAKPSDAAGEEDDDTAVDLLPDGEGMTVLCAGGRGDIDDAAAAMLAQILEVQGAAATSITHEGLQPLAARKLALDKVDTVIVTF